MLQGLNRPLNFLEESHPAQSSYYHQPDIYSTDFTSSNSNQLPLIQCLFDSQNLTSYDFQEPSQLFSNRLSSQISRASSLSCHSSSSSNHPQLNPQHQMSVAEHDCHSPVSLHQSYISTPIDFIQSLTSPNYSLLRFPSREDRSDSISSTHNSNWKVAPPLNNPEGSLESIQWEEQASDWKLGKFRPERCHPRSRSEEVAVHGSTFQPEQCPSYFDMSGPGNYLDPNNVEFQFLQRRTPVPMWPTDGSSTDGGSPFDHSVSVFGLGTFPTEVSLNDQFTSSSNPEGPVMAEFSLPPNLIDKNSNTPPHKRTKCQRSENQGLCEVGTIIGSVTASKKAKKIPSRSTRTNNNGGRCRRLAPANRECPHCGDKFTRNDRLNYHIDSIHEQKERKYKCIECTKAFRQRCDLQRHMRHVHKFSNRPN